MLTMVEQKKRQLLALPFVGFFFIFFVIPIAELFWISLGEAFCLSAYREILSTPVFPTVLWNSFEISLQVAVLAVVLSIPIAQYMTKVGRKVLVLVFLSMVLPMWMSILVRSFSLIVLFQSDGILNQVLSHLNLLGGKMELLYNRSGVLIGMTYIFIPYATLMLYSGFRKVEQQREKIAATLGASRWEQIIYILVPQVKSVVLITFFYVLTVSLGYFITPALLGGAKETMVAMLIDIDINQTFNWQRGAAMSFMVLAIVMIIVICGYFVFNREIKAQLGIRDIDNG